VNVQEYISSGVVESYVLGLLSEEERKEFEQLREQNAEIKAACTAFELSLEKNAMQHAIEPPRELKDKILGQITLNKPAPVIPLARPKAGWLKYAVAACLILLAASVFWNINQMNKNKDLKKQLDDSVTKVNTMEEDMKVLRQNPNIKMASMKGLDISPQSFATVYWDTTSKDVYLLINNLPTPASDKQYQLWSILDGKPVDGGMIDNDFFIHQNKLLIRMKNARGAQSFAITLEKKGGNPTPEGVMYVLGNL
jgi:anti-sigma-K factor RskA